MTNWPWLPAFVFIISLRVIWQIWPNLWTALLFWLVVFYGDVRHVYDKPQDWWFYCSVLGGALNAAVILANKGFMPGTNVGRPMSIWVRSTKAHRLRVLGDNHWAGTSIGDWCLALGLLGPLIL